MLRKALSLSEAKGILGLPEAGTPSKSQVMQAWKTLAFKYHPDRGGELEMMQNINLAKDVLLGKAKPTYNYDRRPEPPPYEPPKPNRKIPVTLKYIEGTPKEPGFHKVKLPDGRRVWVKMILTVGASRKVFFDQNETKELIGRSPAFFKMVFRKPRPESGSVANLHKMKQGTVVIKFILSAVKTLPADVRDTLIEAAGSRL